jgi:hypothetical protein
MGLLQEAIRHTIHKQTKRAIPLFLSGVFLATACGQDPITKNLDCNSDQKSSSTTIFLKKGEKMDVKGLPVKSSSPPGTIEIVPDQISKKIEVIKINPDATIEFTPRHKSLTSPWRKNITYKVSGSPASQNNIEGTNLTIEADCPDQK